MESKKHYSVPTNLHKLPFLSVWKMENYEATSLFIQTSEDEQNPVWLSFGDVLEVICKKELESDGCFLKLILQSLRYGEYDLLIRHMKQIAKQ